MPIYEFMCPECGVRESEYRAMRDSAEPCKCRVCSREMCRDLRAEGAGPHLDTEFRTPIEMHSIALCNDEDIRDFRRRNPDVDISEGPNDELYGVPIARTRKAKLKTLDTEGYEERN